MTDTPDSIMQTAQKLAHTWGGMAINNDHCANAIAKAIREAADEATKRERERCAKIALSRLYAKVQHPTEQAYNHACLLIHTDITDCVEPVDKGEKP